MSQPAPTPPPADKSWRNDLLLIALLFGALLAWRLGSAPLLNPDEGRYAEVPREIRGTGFGVLATVNGVGDLVSSSLVGILWATLGVQVAFCAAAALCAGGLLLLASSGRARQKTQ